MATPEDVLATLGRPGRVPRHPAAMDDLHWLEIRGAGRLAYEAEGQGPAVLLVHGWQGSPRAFSALAEAIRAAGFRTVMPDLPAHGASDGDTVSTRSAAAALLALAAKEGPFEAVIAHSFGCPSTVLALEQGLKTQALVFFAPPADQKDQLRRVCARNGLGAAETEAVLAAALARGVEFLDLPARAGARSEPLLIVHAPDDPMTPIEGAQAIVAAWPGARLIEAEGQGHNGALRDRTMIAASLRFALGV